MAWFDTQTTQSVNNVVCTRFCFVFHFFLSLLLLPLLRCFVCETNKCYRKTFKLLINRLKNSNDDIKQTIINCVCKCMFAIYIAIRYYDDRFGHILAYFSRFRATQIIRNGWKFEIFKENTTWHLASPTVTSVRRL